MSTLLQIDNISKAYGPQVIFHQASLTVPAKRKIGVIGRNGVTALMRATIEGHTETVKALIDAGVDVNARNNTGGTALMVAVREGHAEVVKILKQAGARE